MTPSGSASAVGLFGLHSQMTATGPFSPVRTAARIAAGSIAQPAAAPSRGTATTEAPRCSVMTRYIAYEGVGTIAADPAGRNALPMRSRISSAPAPTTISSRATPYRAAAAATRRR